MSDDFQNELTFPGIESSPAFVREPEGNGCIERFLRTLKEQLLWVRRRPFLSTSIPAWEPVVRWLPGEPPTARYGRSSASPAGVSRWLP